MNQSENIDHNRIIAEVAKSILKPAGMIRKGQSRVWLDDNGWFTTMLEYQPSGHSKGTYLNVGINFNWYIKDYFSFDFGDRESSFIQFRKPDTFRGRIIELSNLGLNKVFEYRRFSNIDHAKRTLLSPLLHRDKLWGNYHKAMICLVTNNCPDAITYFEEILQSERDTQWVNELKDNIRAIIKAIESQEHQTHIMKIIYGTRKALKLPEIEINFS